MKLPRCDCTAQCGDDPDIDRKKCIPCDDYKRRKMLAQGHKDACRIVSEALALSGPNPVQLPRAALELIATVLKHSRI